MSLERAKAYLKEYKMEDQIREFPVSFDPINFDAFGTTPYVPSPWVTKDIPVERLKRMCMPKLNTENPQVKEYLSGGKEELEVVYEPHLKADEVEERIGHAIGGVCPFGIKEGVRVYLDETLKKYETVFPACGSCNSAIELTIPQLEQLAKPVCWVDVCKLPA